MVLFNVDGVGEFEVTPFGGGFSVLNRLDEIHGDLKSWYESRHCVHIEVMVDSAVSDVEARITARESGDSDLEDDSTNPGAASARAIG